MMDILVKDKRVLVFGFGLHGGGLATTKWLLREGAHVRVTDKKTREELLPTLQKLGEHPRLSFQLGGHNEEDITRADIIIVNPGVPREHPHLVLARQLGKPLWNDTAIFFARTKRPVIAVTGTRGKTTVTSWIAQLLSTARHTIHPTGNTPKNPLLAEIARKRTAETPVVAELSSWQLELLPVSHRAPHIAVITNIYPDHLNRYNGIEDYADAKANIFLDQTPEDALVVNADNPWAKYFLAKKPAGRVFVTSSKPLPKAKSGMCIVGKHMVFQDRGMRRVISRIDRFAKQMGTHNVANVLQAALAAHLTDPTITLTEQKLLALSTPEYRQQIVCEKKYLRIVNDTTATSPDGTIAAIRRFSEVGRVILIAGGTDKMLEFAPLAKEIKKYIHPDDLILLDGSATAQLRLALTKTKFPIGDWMEVHDTLQSCLKQAFARRGHTQKSVTILFSPGAASFEKFKNEFDRGAQFNVLVKKLIA